MQGNRGRPVTKQQSVPYFDAARNDGGGYDNSQNSLRCAKLQLDQIIINTPMLSFLQAETDVLPVTLTALLLPLLNE